MRIIIIGASGLIGSNLAAAAKRAEREVIGTYNDTEKSGLIRYDMRSAPLHSVVPDLGSDDVVYLLSAYSNPSWIFEHQATARDLNLTAAKRVIDEVFDADARLIFMSSVEVFDGKTGNYKEEDVPNPLNLYGRMKYEIEKHLAQAGGKSTIVRTGWNVGWDTNHRCVIKLTYETLLKPGAKMANDNTFSICDVRDTAEGLFRLADNDSLEIIHLASTPVLIRSQLADLIMSFSKNKHAMAYRIASFSEISYSEPRAQYNHIDNTLAVAKLGMAFRPAEQIVREKVKLLDAVMEKAVVGV